MITQHHADARVNHFGRNAVAILVGHARYWIPATAVQIGESRTHRFDLFGTLACGCCSREREWPRHAVDHEHLAELFAAINETRRAIEIRRVDEIDIGLWRLGDVRVGRDNRLCKSLCIHDVLPRTRRPGNAPVA